MLSRLKGNLGVLLKVQPPPYAGTRNKVRYFQILMTHSLKNCIVPLSMPTFLFTTERNQMFLNSYLKLSLLDIGLGRHLLDTRVHPIRQLFVSIKSLRIGIFKRYFYFITNTKKTPTNQNTQYVGFFTVSFFKLTFLHLPRWFIALHMP